MNTTHSYPQHLFTSSAVSWYNRSSRFLCFLLVSLALHVLLFTLVPALELSTPAGEQAIQQPIYLILDSATSNDRKARQALTANPPSQHELPQPSHHAGEVHSQPQKAQTQPHPPLQAVAKRLSHHKTSPRVRHTTKEAIATPSLRSGQSILKPSPNPAAVAALLRRALQQHFYYPLVARQNGWEGKVVLGIRVTASGEVGTARILKPSGFRILDRAAQHAANQIGILPAAPPLLADQTLHFRVPVAYRLRH